MLLGEETVRYSRSNGEWVDVCALCRVPAVERGWVKEGALSSPLVTLDRRRLRFPRRARPNGAAALDPTRAPAAETTARVDCFAAACATFNDSAFRRTVSGVAKSLGRPWASLVYLTGLKPEVVITVAWDLSWYQYRVVLSDPATIRLVERGYELDDLDQRFTVANAAFDDDMALAPLDSSPDTSVAQTATS